MKRILILSIIVIVFNASSAFSTETIIYDSGRIDSSNDVVYPPKKIVVKFDPAIMSRMDKRGFAKGKTGVPTLDSLGERYKARVIQKKFIKAKIKKSRGHAIDLSGWHRIKFNKEIVDKIISMVNKNEYKRQQMPIGLKITSKAFGSGRRMPITNYFS